MYVGAGYTEDLAAGQRLVNSRYNEVIDSELKKRLADTDYTRVMNSLNKVELSHRDEYLRQTINAIGARIGLDNASKSDMYQLVRLHSALADTEGYNADMKRIDSEVYKAAFGGNVQDSGQLAKYLAGIDEIRGRISLNDSEEQRNRVMLQIAELERDAFGVDKALERAKLITDMIYGGMNAVSNLNMSFNPRNGIARALGGNGQSSANAVNGTNNRSNWTSAQSNFANDAIRGKQVDMLYRGVGADGRRKAITAFKSQFPGSKVSKKRDGLIYYQDGRPKFVTYKEIVARYWYNKGYRPEGFESFAE